METSVSYTRVGFFVISFTLLFIVAVLWLSVGISGKTYHNYKAFFYESVSGLSVKAPVKYNGVEIGYVKTINLYPKNPRRVRVILSIESTTPLYEGVQATLETQGLTGLAFIELRGGAVNKGLIEPENGHDLAEIPTVPSLFFRLDSALDDLTHNIRDISTNIKAFLNPYNAHAVRETLENFSILSTDLVKNSQKLDAIMNNASITLQQTATASQSLPALMANMKQSVIALNGASTAAKAMLTNGSVVLETVNNQLMPQAITAMSGIQSMIIHLNSLSETLSANPSILIRGQTRPPLGPGEQ